MATKSSVYRGTPSSAATAQPNIAPAHPGRGTGIPLGPDLRTGKFLFIDGYGEREDDQLNGLITRVSGIRGSGKSTFLKTFSFRALGLQAGLDEFGYPLSLRCRITDQRHENGQGEFTEVTEALQSEVISPVKLGNINVFDTSMGDELSLLETAINLSESVLDRRLRDFEPLAHQVAMAKMFQDEFRAKACPSLYERILRGLTIEDVDAYYERYDTALKTVLKGDIDAEWELVDKNLQLLFKRPAVLPIQAFQQDAAQMAASMTQLLYGDYGNLFGDTVSLRDMLSQPVTTIDQTGMSVKMRNIFSSLMGKWQVWAMENNVLDLLPHVNIGDEVQDDYKSLMWLRFYDDFVRKARAYHMWDIRATQFDSRLQTLGPEGSEQRELAKTIDLGVSMRFIFKQARDTEVLQSLSNLGFSDADAWATTSLPKGCCALWMPDRPVNFFQYILTPLEYGLVQSNYANQRMMQRANVWSFEEIQRRAEEAGSITIGVEK